MAGPIALVTDFGAADFYAGQLRAVLRSQAPAAEVVDLCHVVPAGFVPGAAFVLEASRGHFPTGTVFLAVVDPGVGGERDILLVQAEDRFYVGPDNGVLTPLLSLNGAQAWRLRQPGSSPPAGRSTFEGRDRMAPVAARMAGGTPVADLGEPAGAPRLDPQWRPRRGGPGRFDGRVVYIDRFGNVISNLPGDWLAGAAIRVRLGERTITAAASHYEAAPPGPFWLVGSHGFLELAIARGAAATELGAFCGQPLRTEPLGG